MATPEQRRPWIEVGSLARTLDDGHDPAGRPVRAWPSSRRCAQSPASEYLLVEPSGQVYGVLAAQDLDHAFAGV